MRSGAASQMRDLRERQLNGREHIGSDQRSDQRGAGGTDTDSGASPLSSTSISAMLTDCFFLSKEMLYPGSRFRMAEELQQTYIRQLLEAHAQAPEVVVAWQGGEPTITGVEYFRRSVELQREYARPGQRILNTLQTNGTLIDDEFASFLKENNFLVGISIDGPREIHDTYRVSKGGKPTFDRVIRGLEHLKGHDVDWNVLTTLHAANGDHGRRVYQFLRDELGATFIQFIPIIERATAETLEIANSG